MNRYYAIERIKLDWITVIGGSLGVFLLIDAFLLNGFFWHLAGLPK